MSQVSNSAEGSIVPPVPLFSSSLLALYRIIRLGMEGRRRDENNATDTECDEAGQADC